MDSLESSHTVNKSGVTEIIAGKLVKRLMGNASGALGCIVLPSLECSSAQVSSARLKGLDKFKLHPDAPVRVVFTERHMLLSVPLQVKNAKFTGKYMKLRKPALVQGKFSGRLRNLRIDAQIAIGGNHPKLKALDVLKLEGLELISAKGMTLLLNWFLLDLIDDFINKNQNLLFQTIREALWTAFAKHMMNVLPLLDVQYLCRKQKSRDLKQAHQKG
ncbi:uncharacterized protein LOC135377974 isoform X2 [Ornithodoros turicata]|uniref:uncharacterized protein LOC135377974 isoform X2 n=1 Tax=Ornithodoros turicata TaxID=34597 RepID=UPI0031394ABC